MHEINHCSTAHETLKFHQTLAHTHKRITHWPRGSGAPRYEIRTNVNKIACSPLLHNDTTKKATPQHFPRLRGTLYMPARALHVRGILRQETSPGLRKEFTCHEPWRSGSRSLARTHGEGISRFLFFFFFLRWGKGASTTTSHEFTHAVDRGKKGKQTERAPRTTSCQHQLCHCTVVGPAGH